MKTGSRGIRPIAVPPTFGLSVTGTQPASRSGDTITDDEADSLLLNDIATSEQAVSRAVTVPLNHFRFDALVPLVFNIGQGSFRRSTLLKKLNRLDYTGASDEFLRWTHAGGKVVSGDGRPKRPCSMHPGRKSDGQ